MKDIKNELLERKLIVICRKIYGENLIKLATVLNDAGIRFLEVTFDQSDPNCLHETTNAIDMLNEKFGSAMTFGAGTVLTAEQVRAAKKGGAAFIISPNTSRRVIETTKENGLLSVPGAMTPSEIVTAYEYGADFVKLFPIAALGNKYVKDIMAPINHIPLIATGGVTESNLENFFNMGIAGAGIGGRIADRKCLEENNLDELSKRTKAFVDIVERF